jgi:hypothetical protein
MERFSLLSSHYKCWPNTIFLQLANEKTLKIKYKIKSSHIVLVFLKLRELHPMLQKLLQLIKEWGKIWGVWCNGVNQCLVMGELNHIRILSLNL